MANKKHQNPLSCTKHNLYLKSDASAVARTEARDIKDGIRQLPNIRQVLSVFDLVTKLSWYSLQTNAIVRKLSEKCFRQVI